jgi:Zn-finger nucleic acid-binding protein
MPLVCPSCNLERDVEGIGRLDLCPRCRTEGRDVYMIEAPATDRRRRTDLIGLLATARGELARRRQER